MFIINSLKLALGLLLAIIINYSLFIMTTRKASDDEITQAMTVGITFKKAKPQNTANDNKIKTKAKKKTYITGLHGSGAAKKKAEIRQRRANRHKK